jgi:hypothetical protein
MRLKKKSDASTYSLKYDGKKLKMSQLLKKKKTKLKLAVTRTLSMERKIFMMEAINRNYGRVVFAKIGS